MAECQGNVPVTTKVDKSTREFVDELAGDMDVSRAEVLRRLLELYQQSEGGDLECPSCTQTIRIQVDNIELLSAKPDKTPTIKGVDRTKDTEPGSNTTIEDSDTESIILSDFQAQIKELESVIENQQQELEHLQETLARQEREITDLFEPNVSPQRIEYLEEQVEWQGTELQEMIPRIEALTEVSDLTDHGICPTCSHELSVEQSFIDIGDSPAIECPSCGLVVGHRA